MELEEPRSWAAPVKFDPIETVRPTNRQLAKGVDQLHTCLENHRQHTAREFSHVRRDLKELKAGLLERKTAGGQSPRAAWFRTFVATGGAIAATGAVLRFSEFVWPFVKGASFALLHAFEQGRL